MGSLGIAIEVGWKSGEEVLGESHSEMYHPVLICLPIILWPVTDSPPFEIRPLPACGV